MRGLIRKDPFEITIDHDFSSVIQQCRSVPRKNQEGTWITVEMMQAYQRLHDLGHAHSIEVWKEDNLVAGLYGISLGKIFFGESMFTRVPNASKYGFIKLVQWLEEQDFMLIDCQQDTRHLRSLGAELISRVEFLKYLRCNQLSETNDIWASPQLS